MWQAVCRGIGNQVLLQAPAGGESASIAAAVIMGALFLVMAALSLLIRRSERRRLARTLARAAEQVRMLPASLPPEQDETLSQKPLTDADILVSAAREAFARVRGKLESLEGESARNRLLAAEISRFYAHVRVLNGQDFRIDFFEYHADSGHFVFLTGLATLFGAGSQIFREMDDLDFFPRFACSLGEDRPGAPAGGTGPAVSGEMSDTASLGEAAERVRLSFNLAARESLETGSPFLIEFRAFSEEDGYLWLRCWGQPDTAGRKIDGSMLDISREVGQREADRNRFLYDNITGFLNRNALSEIGGRALDTRKPGEMIAFVYFGLRRYSEFENRFGMMAGNSYIRVFADLLRERATDRMTLFRWWGPNFLCIVRGLSSDDSIRTRAEEMLGTIASQQRLVDGISTDFPVTAGYAVAGLHGDTPAELLEHAAFAKHEADSGQSAVLNGFNRERFDESRQVTLRRSFIRDVINRNELYVVYQPIVSLKTAEVHGFEALSRPANGIYRSITELIGDAEDTGHYAILEKRMVYNALDGFMERPEAYRDAWLFINTAPVPALTASDYQDIKERYFGFLRVVYEVIERSRIDPDEMARRKALVRETGARFALDDFGSGYSNHLALLALEPDIIKIDRGLVSQVDKDIRKQQMLEDIIGYARLGGTRVLAEGIETAGELETLCRMGVDYAQGFFLGRPGVSFSGVLPEAAAIIQGMSRNQRPTAGNAVRLAIGVLKLRSGALAHHAQLTGWFLYRLAAAWGYEDADAARLSLAGLLLGVGSVCNDTWDFRIREGTEAQRRQQASAGLAEAFVPEWPFHHVLRCRLDRPTDWSVETRLFLLAERLALQSGEASVPLRKEQFTRVLEGFGWPEGKRLGALLQALAEEAGEAELPAWYADIMAELVTESTFAEGMIRLLACAVDGRSPYLSGHAAQMEKTAEMLSHMLKLGWRMSERVRLAALSGGLGNLSVPAALFDRQGRLSADELSLIRTRAERSRRLLEEAGLASLAELQPRPMDAGTGQERSAEKDVSQGRAILAVSDILAALLQERAWRPAMTQLQAGAVLTDMAEAGLVDALVAETAVENLAELEDGIQTVHRTVQEKLRMATVRLHVVNGGIAGERNHS